MKHYRIALLALATLLVVVGCKKKEPEHQEGPMESAGEEIDETGREIEQETEEAADEAGENIEEAGDAIEEKTDG
jgi:hypothetical protein